MAMRCKLFSLALCLFLLPGLCATRASAAQPKLALITAPKRLKSTVPGSFYLEGDAIPVEMYHAVLLQAGRKQFIIALLATSGYSSNVRQKYLGMIISEGRFRLNTLRLGIGSYGFGLATIHQNGKTKTVLRLFNQAGRQVGQSPVRWDSHMAHPSPIQAAPGKSGSVRIYLGRHWLRLRP